MIMKQKTTLLCHKVSERLQKLASEGVITFDGVHRDKYGLSNHFNVFLDEEGTKRSLFIEITNTALNGAGIRIPSESFPRDLKADMEDIRQSSGLTARQNFAVSVDPDPSKNQITADQADQYVDKIETFLRGCKARQPAFA